MTQKQNEIIYKTVIVSAVSYTAYWTWKNRDKIKEQFQELFPKKVKIDPTDITTFEEIQKMREVKRFEQAVESTKSYVENLGEDESVEVSYEDDWFELNGRMVRSITREERINGIDYDPYLEELVTFYDSEGSPIEYVAKLEKNTSLYNASESRQMNDIIESVDDFADSIYILKKNGDHDDVMDLRATYEPNSTERLDYFYAMLLDFHLIEDMTLRRKLINLFTWDFVPNAYITTHEEVYSVLIQKRQEFFGFESPHADRVSVGEVILYYGERYHANVPGRHHMEEYIQFQVNNIPLNFDGTEHDAIIHDTLISYMEHGRSLHPNATGGYGLFGISEDDYEETSTLESEFQKSLGYLQTDGEYFLPINMI